MSFLLVFSLCWNPSFRGRQSTVSMVFWRTQTETVLSLRWRITLLKQRVLCELSEIAETLSIVNVKVFKLFIFLIVWKLGSRGRIAKEHKFKETKYITLTREKSFLWMEVVFENEFCNLQIYSAFRSGCPVPVFPYLFSHIPIFSYF